MRTIRCAIYTRKSSEEGLEQEFNSLDAQREACEAYIKSQKGAGWLALPELYDDGGISGGTMERPALQRLLTDIATGRVDTVIVYKVDRLTRSLRDFARIVDAFDAKAVSFVSVTQQFNTTNSMGRLTLNMLLSFAQFEREVTSERIRDKIAASKQKGMWMGGQPPLGYDVKDRKLVVNEPEAHTVRQIFCRYVALRSVHSLKHELDRDGIVSKARRDRNGNAKGGMPIAVGALYHILQNKMYRGEMVHKGKTYPGQHDAVVDQKLWDEAQASLATNRGERATRTKAANPSLLAGLVYDANGVRMSPTHAIKNGVRYRYYVSQSLIKRSRATPCVGACRIPAADLETLVEESIRDLLKDPVAMEFASTTTVADRKAIIARAADLARRWPELLASERRRIFGVSLSRIEVRAQTIGITVRQSLLFELILGDKGHDPPEAPNKGSTIVLTIPARIKRTGLSNKLLVEGKTASTRLPDRSLLRLIAMAQRFNVMVMNSAGKKIGEIAAAAGVSRSYFTRVLRLSFLAPEIIQAIIQGRQPAEFSAIKLMRTGQFALRWSEQRHNFGFD